MQARDELVDYVCKKEMGVYSQIFTPVGDTAQLDRVGMFKLVYQILSCNNLVHNLCK